MKWNITQPNSSLPQKNESQNVTRYFFIKSNIYWELKLGDLVVRILVTYVWENCELQFRELQFPQVEL